MLGRTKCRFKLNNDIVTSSLHRQPSRIIGGDSSADVQSRTESVSSLMYQLIDNQSQNQCRQM